jgi:hypothetical protein
MADIDLVANTNKVRKVNTKPIPNTIKVRPSSIKSDDGTVAAPVIYRLWRPNDAAIVRLLIISMA